jgi:ubiquinone biosynthesis protein UbiJ
MPNLLSEKIEALLNRALLLDAQTHRRFCTHAGRRIGIELTDLEIDFVFRIHESGIELDSPTGQPVDVTISGRIVSLLGLLGRRDASNSLFPKDIQIRGDVHLAQELQTLLQGMDIDWEEYASRWIGDTAARKLGNLARANVRW